MNASILVMKSVFVVGSRKFYQQIKDAVRKLKRNNIPAAAVVGKWNGEKGETLEGESAAIQSAFREIDECDVVYVFSKDGYIGNSVSVEIAYAYARRKELIAMHDIKDKCVQTLVPRVMGCLELIKYCKRGARSR